MRGQWYACDGEKSVGVNLSATEYHIDTGVIIPYVSLLNMHNCHILRHEVKVPGENGEEVRFVAFTGDHKIPNKALRKMDSKLFYCGELVIFRVAQGKSWSTIINLRGGKTEEAQLDLVARKYVDCCCYVPT